MKPVNNLFYLIFFLLFNPITLSAQQENDSTQLRIHQIKIWYDEAQEARKNGTLVQLDTNWVEFELYDEEKVAFPKIRKFSQLTDEISLIEIEAYEFDGGNNIELYLYNGEPFFLFAYGGAESHYFENRLYFNTKGFCIRFLERNNEENPDIEDFENLPHNILNPTDSNLAIDFYQKELVEFGHEGLILK